MRIAIFQRLLGLLLMIFSISMLPPVVVSLIYKDGMATVFMSSFFVTLLAGFFIWLPARADQQELRLRDGFLVVAGFWVVLGSFGAVPFLFSETPSLSFTDAMFEAISGLTTTGATILSGLDDLPHSILYYRQQLQWLGGMGIIVLAVAVLPMLGVGGMQLYRAETPGPMKDNKLTPRITGTAKALWYIYLALTVGCGLSYFLAGMTPFDAVCHAFSTIAIGGFSTHDASMGFFNDPRIEMIAVVFMFLAGVNFALHFGAVAERNPRAYWRDAEFRAYTAILGLLIVGVVTYLLVAHEYDSFGKTITQGIFQVVSISTTTGFTTTDYSSWPGALPVMLLFASFIGACAGSTGGGMKVVRCLLVYKQGAREVRRLIHPSAEMPVKLGDESVPQRVIEAVWGFFAVYVVVFAIMMLVLLAAGMDQVTAFSAIAASLNNLGPGLGDVAAGFGTVPDLAKWVCVGAMLLGRLEIFTLLVLVSATFWRH